MADPLSVAASCIAVIGAAGTTAGAILSFIKTCREARSDLTNISRELTDLQITLELLKDDGQGDELPIPLRSQIVSMVNSCGSVISDIDVVLQRHKGKNGSLRWAVDGKKEVEGLRRGLETYRESLSLTVEAVTLSLAKSIKSDTEAIRGQTCVIPDIKDDTERILDGIEDLRISMLPTETQAWSKSPLLDDYLDGLTSYAETVCDDIVWESEIEDENEEATTVGELDEKDTDDTEVTQEGVEETQQRDMGDEPAAREANQSSELEEERNPSPITPGISDEGCASKNASEEGDSERKEQAEPPPAMQPEEEKKQPTAPIRAKPASRPWQEKKCHNCNRVRSSLVGDDSTMVSVDLFHTFCASCIRQKFAQSISSDTNLAANRPICCWSSGWIPPSLAEHIIDRITKSQYNRKYRRVSFVCPIKSCERTHEIASDATRRWKIYCRHTRRGVCSWCFEKWHGKSDWLCDKGGEAQQLFDLTSKSSKS